MEKKDLILENKSFYVAGYEYNYDYVFLFLNKPLEDVDERGSRFYRVVDPSNDISDYLGLKIPVEIVKYIGFPLFDGAFSIIKIDENINTYLRKQQIKFRINDNFKLELI